MNYIELQAKLSNWLNKSNADIVVPDFIRWGQAWIEDEILLGNMRTPIMEFESSTTTYIPKGTNLISVPSDYLELIYINLTDQLITPIPLTFTAGAGTLIGGTYYYRITATDAHGETQASAQTSFVSAGGGVNVNWTKVTGATGYKIYGRTTNAELLMATVGDVATWLDNGSISPSGALPVNNTTGTTRYYPLQRYSNKEFPTKYQSIDIKITNLPQAYERKDSSFVLNVYTDKDYVYNMRYYRRLSTLSNTTPTNGWLDNADELLLYASLCKSKEWLGDDKRMMLWVDSRDKLFRTFATRMQRESMSGQRGQYGSPNVFNFTNW